MWRRLVEQRAGIAPLIALRIAFGVLMAASLLRSVAKGWVDALYVKPTFFFTYYGFGWVHPCSATGMHIVFFMLIICALCIALGALYRIAAPVFFVLFTYVELLDKTVYLNHYYFITLVSLLLCIAPAHRAFSLDVRWRLAQPTANVPAIYIRMFQLQLALVYFFAGIAKINGDWLLHAMPLRLWLPTRNDLPIIGALLSQPWVAYVFSWCGMLFDTFIAFFLLRRSTSVAAYFLAFVFHVLTAILFPGIGMFPFIMIACAVIFLPENLSQHALMKLGWRPTDGDPARPVALPVRVLLIAYFAVQFLLPLRYLLYPGRLFYNEEGYRFSWRVMLMEKAGTVFFTLRDPATGKRYGVNNAEFLTHQQEKQMSTQPDMILQFAHHLQEVNAWRIPHAEVYAEAYVGVNGAGSRPFIHPDVDLAKEQDSFAEKKWVQDE